jgi:hypothetical protein
MDTNPAAQKIHPQNSFEGKQDRSTNEEKVLCSHCLRTATNGIKCKGMCVADSDY